MFTAKQITTHFINKGFQPKQLKNPTALGLKAFYKSEELNYTPSMFSEEEFIALYTVHATNLRDEKKLLTEEQLNNGLTSGWVSAVSKLSSEWSYPQRNYRAGHQVILIPRPYITSTGILMVKSGFKPNKEEIAIIDNAAVFPFRGYDENGRSFPFGIDFIKLFNVGKSVSAELPEFV